MAGGNFSIVSATDESHALNLLLKRKRLPALQAGVFIHKDLSLSLTSVTHITKIGTSDDRTGVILSATHCNSVILNLLKDK